MSGHTEDIITEWEEGALTDQQALRHLLSEYGEIQSELTPLETELKTLRGTIERITDRLGGKASASGFDMAISNPSTRVSYDVKQLDSLLAKLTTNGLFDIAEELSSARKESVVSGSLRITKAKVAK